MLAHEFDDQRMAAQVAHFVQVLDFKAEDALEAGLGDGQDPAVLEVLPEEHAEGRRLQRSLSCSGRKISERERSVRGEVEPALAASPFRRRLERKDQLVTVGLRYFVYSGA